MSVSASGGYRGGYFRNAYSGERADRERTWALRWKTAWRPAANLLIENVASGGYARQNG